MENKPIIGYGRIVGDDGSGAFEKAKAEVVAFEKFILDKAEKLKGALSVVDYKDTKAISDHSKELDEIKKAQVEIEKAMQSLNKTQKLYNKLQKEANLENIESTESLDDLYIMLEQYKVAVKVTNELEKEGSVTIEEATKARGRARLSIKAISAEIRKQEKAIIDNNSVSKDELKLIQAEATVRANQIDTLQQVRDRMSALRLIVQNTSLTTEEGRKRIQQYNQEIDELTNLLSENSDKFIQNKINIGNYSESIKEALQSTDLFKTNIAILDKGLDLLINALFRNTKAVKNNTRATVENTEKIGILTKIQKFVIGIFKKNTTAVEENTDAIESGTDATETATDALHENTEATDENTQGQERAATSTRNLGKAFKGLGNVLKATGIVLVLSIVASLFSIFKQGRSGVIATDKAMSAFNVTLKVIIATLADLGGGIYDFVSGFVSSFSNIGLLLDKIGLKFEIWGLKVAHPLGGAKEEIAELEAQVAKLDKQMEEGGKEGAIKRAQGFARIVGSLSGFTKRVSDARKSIEKDFEGIIRAFEIGDEIKKAELQLIETAGRLSKLEIRADDDTLSLRTMLLASKMAMEQRIKLMKEENRINGLNLELANAKAKTDVLANATSLAGVKGAQKLLALAEKKRLSTEEEVAFAKQLLEVNSNIDLRTQTNPLDDSLLAESVEALKNYKQGLQDIVSARLANAVQLRKIDRDIFEQNLDFLIDLIDTEKNLSEQMVNNTAENYEKRLDEFGRFIGKFKLSVQQELDEFNSLAQRNLALLKLELIDKGNTAEDIKFIQSEIKKLEAVKLRVEFDENNNLKVFNGDVELALDNTKLLNDQLQNLGLAEIPINRFLEIARETRAWTKDTEELRKSLVAVGLALNQIREENIVSEKQLADLRQLNLIAGNIDFENTTDKSRFEILKKLEKLEKDKTKLVEEAEDERLRIRLRAIADELSTTKKGSEDEAKLLQEKIGIENDLEQRQYDRRKTAIEDSIKLQQEKWDALKEALFSIFDKITDKFVEMANKQVDANQKRLDKQEKATDVQRERAQAGLQNTLAFEQQQLAKREADLEKSRKRAQNIEKVKALYASYTANANQAQSGVNYIDPLTKTLRDFAILEAIQASFGDGGLAVDKIPHDGRGITRGQSHKGNNGGIPVMIEGNEGFLSGREVSNLGKQNFYSLKSMLGRGKVSPDLFKRQKSDFVSAMPILMDNSSLERGLKDVRDEIRNKPVSGIDVQSLKKGMIEIIETVKTPTKTVKTRHIIKKPRL